MTLGLWELNALRDATKTPHRGSQDSFSLDVMSQSKEPGAHRNGKKYYLLVWQKYTGVKIQTGFT